MRTLENRIPPPIVASIFGLLMWLAACYVPGLASKTSGLIIKGGQEELSRLAVNEYRCMSAARTAGIAMPELYLSANAK